MNSVTYEHENSNTIIRRIEHFFKRFRVGKILKDCNAYKEQGIPVLTVILYLFQLIFRNRSMYLDMQVSNKAEFSKDTVYRLKNSIHINWLRFTTMLARTVIRDAVENLTSKERKNVFIVDDTVVARDRSSKVELLARVNDHARSRYVRGFRMLTLGWSDGASFIPVNSCLLSTENKENRIVEARKVNEQSYGAMARKMAQTKSTDVVPQLIKQAQQAGLYAKYVLFDSWFTSPKMIFAMKALNLETVAMVKKTEKIHFQYQGEMLSDKAIFKRSKKRRGRAKYLLSAMVNVCYDDRSMPAKLVYVRNRNKKNEYLVLISTDADLTEQEIIQLYGKRWDIEVFFKTTKSLLNLTGECRSLSYDAMCTHVALVFMRYIFLAVEIREGKDDRSIGPLFCLVCDEIAEITFSAALEKLQLFLEKCLRRFIDWKPEICKVIESLKADLSADIAVFFDLNRLFKEKC